MEVKLENVHSCFADWDKGISKAEEASAKKPVNWMGKPQRFFFLARDLARPYMNCTSPEILVKQEIELARIAQLVGHPTSNREALCLDRGSVAHFSRFASLTFHLSLNDFKPRTLINSNRYF
jgi:hypothetical protein